MKKTEEVAYSSREELEKALDLLKYEEIQNNSFSENMYLLEILQRKVDTIRRVMKNKRNHAALIGLMTRLDEEYSSNGFANIQMLLDDMEQPLMKLIKENYYYENNKK